MVSDCARQLELVKDLWVIDSCEVLYKRPMSCRIGNQESVFSIQCSSFISLCFLLSILRGLADLDSSYTTKPLNSILTVIVSSIEEFSINWFFFSFSLHLQNPCVGFPILLTSLDCGDYYLDCVNR